MAAAGIVAEEGLMGSRLASLAREFGRPMIINVGKASRMLHTGDMVTLCADGGVVFPGQVECLLDKAPPPHDYMPGSPVMHSLQKAAEHILPLTHDVDSIEFRAANCQTYHDIARYCHEKAVSAMFSLGSDKKHAAVRVKQLRDKVLKQFWVVNLNDGFRVQRNEPYIDIEEIASLPMLFVWYGMNAYPWQGPPPVDGKANQALCRLIAELCGVPKGRVEIASGHASRSKALRIAGIPPGELRALLSEEMK